jgi:hypothetical protein
MCGVGVIDHHQRPARLRFSHVADERRIASFTSSLSVSPLYPTVAHLECWLDERIGLKATVGSLTRYKPSLNGSETMDPAANRGGDHASFRSSVWYLGARSLTFFTKAASCSASSAGVHSDGGCAISRLALRAISNEQTVEMYL